MVVLSNALNQLNNSLGINFSSTGFSELLNTTTLLATDLKELKNKLADLQAVSATVRKAASQGEGKAVIIEPYMKFGSVEMNFLMTNPTNTAKVVKFRTPLPEEVEPKDIKDLDGLSLNYDINTNAYYAEADIVLLPGESTSRKIVIKDIWMHGRETIDLLKMKVDELLILANTTRQESKLLIASLKNSIMQTINSIANNESQSFTTPQDHIITYRKNASLLTVVEDDLNKLSQAVMQTNVQMGGVQLAEQGGVSKYYLNSVIFAMAWGLGLLLLIVFKMWHSQVRLAATIHENSKILKRLK